MRKTLVEHRPQILYLNPRNIWRQSAQFATRFVGERLSSTQITTLGVKQSGGNLNQALEKDFLFALRFFPGDFPYLVRFEKALPIEKSYSLVKDRFIDSIAHG